MINESGLPIELRRTKKSYAQSILKQSGLLLLFCIAFWYGSGCFFTKGYYYPPAVVAMPIAIMGVTGLLIIEIIHFMSNKPIVSITQQGIQFCNKPFKAVGVIMWQDITSCQEMAEGMRGRDLALFVKDPFAYINNVQNYFSRREMRRFCKEKNNALASFRLTSVDCDPAELKHFINDMISKK